MAIETENVGVLGESLKRLPRSDDSAWRSRLALMARLTRSTTALLILLVDPPGDCEVVCCPLPATARCDGAGTADRPRAGSPSLATSCCRSGNGAGTAVGSKSAICASSCTLAAARGRSRVAIVFRGRGRLGGATLRVATGRAKRGRADSRPDDEAFVQSAPFVYRQSLQEQTRGCAASTSPKSLVTCKGRPGVSHQQARACEQSLGKAIERWHGSLHSAMHQSSRSLPWISRWFKVVSSTSTWSATAALLDTTTTTTTDITLCGTI